MRTKLISLFIALIASAGTIFAEFNEYVSGNEHNPCYIASGYCGAQGDGFNLSWSLSCDSVLSITGTGEMATFPYYSSPWSTYKSRIAYVELPQGLTSIGQGAFKGCYKLKAIDLPEGVERIEASAFDECGIQTISFPNSLRIIGNNAFANCQELQTVNISSNVDSIGFGAFVENCNSLTNINVAEDNIKFCSIDGVLYNKDKTILIRYPTGRQDASYNIPNSVTHIGVAAFGWGYNLTSISIPNKITSIGDYAFSWCRNLTSITNYATIPQAINSNVFEGVETSTPLYVPAQSITLYQESEIWSDFTNILSIGATETETTEIVTDTTETTVTITWPQINDADTYEIDINDAEDTVICTYTFDSQGYLLNNMTYAPSKNRAPHQTQTAGFSFTINGLIPGTTYGYELIARDSNGNVLNTDSGFFTTPNNSSTAIENVSVNLRESHKTLRNGQVLIIRGDKTYTIAGQETK